MKIKGDFITNSSSTSFLLAFKGEASYKKILAASGIKENSILRSIFEDFLKTINFEPLIVSELENHVYEIYKEKIEDLKKSNMKLYVGKFSSDYSLIETFFCLDEFLIENEEVYFDGSITIW